jgi:hypothetical protein
MLVAVHTASRAPGRLAQGSNATFFASSNFSSYSLSHVDENLEYNIWPHPMHQLFAPTTSERPLRREILNPSPTNR